MQPVSEQFGTRLVRVIKKVKRRTKDGGIKTVDQSFHVKKANPGDVYASGKGGTVVPKPGRRIGPMSAEIPTAADAQALLHGDEDPTKEQPVEEQEPLNRLVVRYDEATGINGQ